MKWYKRHADTIDLAVMLIIAAGIMGLLVIMPFIVRA